MGECPIPCAKLEQAFTTHASPHGLLCAVDCLSSGLLVHFRLPHLTGQIHDAPDVPEKCKNCRRPLIYWLLKSPYSTVRPRKRRHGLAEVLHAEKPFTAVASYSILAEFCMRHCSRSTAWTTSAKALCQFHFVRPAHVLIWTANNRVVNLHILPVRGRQTCCADSVTIAALSLGAHETSA